MEVKKKLFKTAYLLISSALVLGVPRLFFENGTTNDRLIVAIQIILFTIGGIMLIFCPKSEK